MMEREFHFFVEPETAHEYSDSLAAEGSEDVFTEDDDSECEGAIGSGEGRNLIVRLDKWLWAARFFKTRALARAAVEAGKVFYNGERSKPSREIEVDAILQVRQGRFEKTVIVKGLSTRRRSTEEALQLFEETEESKALREQQSQDFQPNYAQSQSNYRQNHARPSHQEQATDLRPVRFLRRALTRSGQKPEPQHNTRQTSYVPQHRPQRSATPYRHHRGHNQFDHHNPYHHSSSHPNRYSHPQSGYPDSAYPQQNDNNPVYGNRSHHSGYNYNAYYNNNQHNNGYHHRSRQPHYHQHYPVSHNKAESQTEFEK